VSSIITRVEQKEAKAAGAGSGCGQKRGWGDVA